MSVAPPRSSRLFRLSVWAAAWALAGLLSSGCRDDERSLFDFSSEPIGEVILISSEEGRPPILVEGQTQSDMAARARFGETCDGYVGEHAPYRLRLEKERELRLDIESETAEDLVLVLSGRSGLRCNDDAKGLMPGLQTRLAAGDYSVFVGTLHPSSARIPYRLVIRDADPGVSYQGLPPAELAAEFLRLAQWVTPVSASALASLETRIEAQRAAFEREIPTRVPDIHARALLGVQRVERGQEGEILRQEYESQGEAPLWQLHGACGGFTRSHGADVRLRVSSAFDGRVECQASADVEIELAIRGPQNQWRCGGRRGEGIASLALDTSLAGEHAVMVAAVEPEPSFRVLLSCVALGDHLPDTPLPPSKDE